MRCRIVYGLRPWRSGIYSCFMTLCDVKFIIYIKRHLYIMMQ